jgi:hypothetical protein
MKPLCHDEYIDGERQGECPNARHICLSTTGPAPREFRLLCRNLSSKYFNQGLGAKRQKEHALTASIYLVFIAPSRKTKVHNSRCLFHACLCHVLALDDTLNTRMVPGTLGCFGHSMMMMLIWGSDVYCFMDRFCMDNFLHFQQH